MSTKAVRKGQTLTTDQFRRRFRYQMQRRAEVLRIFTNVQCSAASALKRKDLKSPDLVKQLQSAASAYGCSKTRT